MILKVENKKKNKKIKHHLISSSYEKRNHMNEKPLDLDLKATQLRNTIIITNRR